jgi:hypothetical protein
VKLRFLERLDHLLRAQATRVRRILLRTDARERKDLEADRLDRLRNPGDYRGK